MKKRLKSLIFPGSWFAIMGLLCLVRLDATFAGLLAAIVGMVTNSFVRGRRASENRKGLPHRIATRAAVSVGILIVSLVLTRLYYWITWNPIGQSGDNGWGISWGIQDNVEQLPEVSDSHDLVATASRTSSGLLSVSVPTTYFIFVHRQSEQDNRDNLALRYSFNGDDFGTPPKMKWKGQELLISLRSTEPFTITMQRGNVQGVRIIYAIEALTYRREVAFWQRPFL